MNKAIELALHLRKQNPDRITWSITTDSVTLVDDIEPDDVVSNGRDHNAALDV